MQCVICGRFISYEDVETGQVFLEYTPDSEFTKETIEYMHRSCADKNNLTNED